MELKDRLRIAMEAAGMNQAALARACGVTRPSVSGWLSGKGRFLRGENLLAAANALGISQQWLATGEGSMKPAQHNETVSVMARWMATLTDIERDLALSAAQAAVSAFRKSQDPPSAKSA